MVAQLVKASAHALLPEGGVGSNPGGCSWEPPLFYESLGRASILEIAAFSWWSNKSIRPLPWDVVMGT